MTAASISSPNTALASHFPELSLPQLCLVFVYEREDLQKASVLAIIDLDTIFALCYRPIKHSVKHWTTERQLACEPQTFLLAHRDERGETSAVRRLSANTNLCAAIFMLSLPLRMPRNTNFTSLNNSWLKIP